MTGLLWGPWKGRLGPGGRRLHLTSPGLQLHCPFGTALVFGVDLARVGGPKGRCTENCLLERSKERTTNWVVLKQTSAQPPAIPKKRGNRRENTGPNQGDWRYPFSSAETTGRPTKTMGEKLCFGREDGEISEELWRGRGRALMGRCSCQVLADPRKRLQDKLACRRSDW